MSDEAKHGSGCRASCGQFAEIANSDFHRESDLAPFELREKVVEDQDAAGLATALVVSAGGSKSPAKAEALAS